MRVASRSALPVSLALALLLGSCSGDSRLSPPAVSSVVIITPTTAPAFQTFGRTVLFAAQARNADDVPIVGASITWSSSNTDVATISSLGQVTAVGNGSTEVRASSGGVQSTPVTVTVSQVARSVAPTPTSVTFGALGSTRQLAAEVRDSGGAALEPQPTITWSLRGDGSSASVSAAGLVTALAVGVTDTAVATAGALEAAVPITVAQLLASIAVTADGDDLLATTGRTRQYSAAGADSNGNAMPVTPDWSSTVEAVATVSAGGLATAVSDGSTLIRATDGGVTGERALTVERFASTFTLSPPTASITADAGTQGFTGTATDSVGTALPITWLSRNETVATVSPTEGANTTATATGNGSTYILMSAGTRTDSSALSVSGQTAAPSTIAVTVGDFFFRSNRNNSENAAVDTLAVGGTVTWTFTGSVQHSVRSLGTPSFTSSGLLTTGTFERTFGAAGTYQYDCQVHANMTGTIVVR